MDLLARHEIFLDVQGEGIKLMTWNVLADQFALDFPAVAQSNLLWANRRVLILEEIVRNAPDIICLQELDHYEDFLEPELKSRGYGSVFKKKRGWHKDGLSIFYSLSKFSQVDSHEVVFPGHQFAIGLQLEGLDHKNFLIFTTHLKAKSQFDLLRVEQIATLFKYLSAFQDIPIILCGDFHSIPGSNAYISLLGNAIGLTSVYGVQNEPEFTTVKQRNTLEVKTEDYIWQRGFRPTGILSIPSLEEIGATGLPSGNYPSDHISLVAFLAYT